MTSSPVQDEIREEIAKLADFVETAQRLIHQSTLVDITPLHARLEQVCQKIKQAPRPQARDVLGDLENLFKSIERLEKYLDLQHDALSEHFYSTQTQANPLFAQEVRDDEQED
ncbi:hypothetical protein [Terasakiella pusilla]|uniref:hypothetical protein n=1 Tax=Terasakiella pusilla TaxID=64973 RepID=UPI003AA7ED1C